MKCYEANLVSCLAFGISLLAAMGNTSAAELPTFEVTAKDGQLLPQRLEVPAKQKIKITIKNEGPGAIEFESEELRVEKVLVEGASSFVVIHPLDPGTYHFFDEFHPQTSKLELVAQ